MANFPTLGMTFFWSSSTSMTTVAAGSNTIGQIINVSGPSGSAPSIDVTHLGSGAREFIMGLRNEGELSIDVIFDPSDAGQFQLWTDRNARTKKGWVLKMSTYGTGNVQYIRSKGYLTGYNITNNIDDVMRASLTVLISSAVTLSSVSS